MDSLLAYLPYQEDLKLLARFPFGEDLDLLDDATRRLLRERVQAQHEVRWRKHSLWGDLDEALALQGITTFGIPEEFSGPGALSYPEYLRAGATVARAIGAYSQGLGIDTAGLSLGRSHVLAFGSEDQKRLALTPLCEHGHQIAWGLTSTGSGSKPLHPSAAPLRARRDGENWILSGAKIFITVAHRANWLVLITATDEGPTTFLVPRDSEGLSVSLIHKTGLHDSETTGSVPFFL